MKIRPGRTMRIYWFFMAVLLSVFVNISNGKPNLYFPGQAYAKSLPRMGRRSGSDIGPGRYPWNDIHRPVPAMDRNPVLKYGGSGESKDWDRLLSSNDFVLPGNEMVFPYRKPMALTRFQDMAEDRQNQFDNSNGIFNYGDK